MLADGRDFSAGQQIVDRKTQPVDGSFQTPLFPVRIFRDQVRDDDTRLMQHYMTEADTFGKTNTVGGNRPGKIQTGGFLGNGFQFAGGDHFGNHHGRRLQRFDFVFQIGPVRLVLDDKNAKCTTGSQDRHTEEGIIGLFTRFRQIGKARVGTGVGQVQRPGFGRDQADKTLADAQRGIVDRFALQTFGRIEFENTIGAQDINGTDFRDDVRGDQHHDLVESLLRRDRLRHDFAKPAEQKARSG